MDFERHGTNSVGEDDVRVLSLVDIFEPLSSEELKQINWKSLSTRAGRGKTFYTPMDLAETLFVVREGRVRVFRKSPGGREFTVAVLESGTVFGEMSLTGQRLRNSYAQAVEDSEVAAMCRADVERLILDRPRVGLQLVHLLSNRLWASETRMEDLATKTVPARLAGLILLLVEEQGVVTRDGYKVPVRYTHRQLGTMIGANREVVTRAFSRLREAGAIATRRRFIHVEDIEILRGATEDDFFHEEG